MLHLIADVSLNHHLITACHRRNALVHFLPATKARIEGMSNLELLQVAASQDRIVISHDIHTMPRDFAAFLESGKSSPGVFLLHPQTPIAEAAAWLEVASLATEASDWDDLIVEIPFLRLVELPIDALPVGQNTSSMLLSLPETGPQE